MKKLISFLAFSFCALAANAQATHNMKITFQDGNTVVYGMENVKTVEFVEKDEPSAKTTYTINGVEYPMPEAVDLGLPSGTKWASMNVGSSSPTDGGLYFAYADPIYRGEVYDHKDYIYLTDSINYITCPPVANTIGTEYDIAAKNINKSWCMPSSNQLKELFDNCSFVYNENLFCYRVIGPNNNFIILPCPEYYEPQDWHIGEYMAGDVVLYFGVNPIECMLCLCSPVPQYNNNYYIWGNNDFPDGVGCYYRTLVRPVFSEH